jgi:MYXO-CTERM domain-containing protein
MKRLHSLLLTALCLLTACDPPPSAPGGWQLETSSLRVDALTGNNTSFPDQRVCGSTAEQLITVHNDETSVRQISFAEAAEPFVLTAIQNVSGTRVGLPFAPVTLNPGKSMSFFVKFSPRIPKAHTGYLTVYSDAPLPLQIPLSGKGTGPRLELSSSSLTLSLPTATSDAGVSDDGGTSPSSTVTSTIRLTNIGNLPLTSLSLVGPGSSSFSAHLSKSVTTSAPLDGGDFVDLVVTFNPTTTEPISTDTLSVVSDDPCMPAARIELTGFRTTDSPTVVSPTALTFAEQEVGTSSAPQSVKVLNGGDSALTVDSMTIRGDSDAETQFIVSPSGKFSLPPGASRNLSVRFEPKAAGHPRATLQLTTSSGASFPPISLSGDAVQAAPLTIEATSIDFSTQIPGQTQTKTVIVRNPGSSPLTVNAAVASPDTSLNLTVNPASFTLAANGGSQELVVTLRPSSSTVAGPWNGKLTLASGVTATPSRQTIIPLYGSIALTPVIPSETAISFNDHVVGTPPQEREFVLQNITALPVTVNKLSTPSLDPFSVNSLPVTIPAKGTQTVKVLFNPTSRNPWDVSLRLTSDASDAIVPVKLSGKAIAPELSVDSSLSLGLDFGPKMPGTRISQKVTLTNTGDADALVTRIAPSLDSTPFSVEGFSPPQKVTKGGGTLSFDVVFNPQELGTKKTTLLFYVDHSSTALESPRLNLSGTSSSAVGSLSPSDVVDFGYWRVDASAPKRMKVKISNDASANEPLKITGVSIDNSTGFTIAGSYTGQTVNAGSTLDVWLDFKPIKGQDFYSGTLIVAYQGVTTGVPRTMSVPLMGKVATAVLNTVDTLSFGAVELNTPRTLQLIISNDGNSTLHINAIGFKEPGAGPFVLSGQDKWPKDIGAGMKEEIDINFVTSSQAVVSKTVVIESNATAGGTVDAGTGLTKTEVILSGQGGVVRASFHSRQIGFDKVPIGLNATIGLRIDNVGSLPLRIEKPIPSSSFTVRLSDTETWPVSIPAQGFFTFPIVFSPAVASDSLISESITFMSNDPAERTVAITLTGKGIKPTLKVDSSVEFGEPRPDDGGVGYKQLSWSLALSNTTEAPLEITNLSITGPFCIFIPSSSDCVYTLSGAALRELVPAIPYMRSESIKLQVTPTSPGRTEGTLFISTNEVIGTTTKVALGVGQKEVSIPSATLDFGTCLMDELSTTKQENSINVSNLGTVADSITDVLFEESDGPDFELVNKLSSPLPVPAGGLATLNLSFNPKKGAAGQREATAKIFTKNKGPGSPLKLNLKGVATGEFSGFKDFQWEVDYKTRRLSDGKVLVRFPLQNQLNRPIYVKTYSLEGAGKDDFDLELDESCRLDSTRQIEIRMGETCFLKLWYVTEEVKLSSATLVLEMWTRDSDSLIPSTRVALKGERVSSFLVAEPQAVNFDWKDLGQSFEPQLITVTNRSAVATRVLIPQVIDAEEFTVEALEPGKELPPAGTTQLRVTFQPKMAGEPTGHLLLRLQGDDVTDVTITLTGHVRDVDPIPWGCSSASGGGPLWAGVLLLMALGARRRSRKASQ